MKILLHYSQSFLQTSICLFSYSILGKKRTAFHTEFFLSLRRTLSSDPHFAQGSEDKWTEADFLASPHLWIHFSKCHVQYSGELNEKTALFLRFEVQALYFGTFTSAIYVPIITIGNIHRPCNQLTVSKHSAFTKTAFAAGKLGLPSYSTTLTNYGLVNSNTKKLTNY